MMDFKNELIYKKCILFNYGQINRNPLECNLVLIHYVKHIEIVMNVSGALKHIPCVICGKKHL